MSILHDILLSLTEAIGKDSAGRIIDGLQRQYGGESIYIPRRPMSRAETVLSAVSSMSVKEAAKECGITERRVYQLLHKMKAEKSATAATLG